MKQRSPGASLLTRVDGADRGAPAIGQCHDLEVEEEDSDAPLPGVPNVGFRDPATLERFELWGAWGDLNLPSLPTHNPPKPSASSSKRHKDKEIYTGSGHHCGVIP